MKFVQTDLPSKKNFGELGKNEIRMGLLQLS